MPAYANILIQKVIMQKNKDSMPQWHNVAALNSAARSAHYTLHRAHSYE